MNKLQQFFQIYKNMGFGYIYHRSSYELKRKSGLLKKKFPSNYKTLKFISLADWRINSPNFFFNSKEELEFPKRKNDKLRDEFSKYQSGELKFFNSKYYDIGMDYDWLTNPLTGYKYNINTHWTEIEDLDKNVGDIKYVWEKSRFSFLYLLIRYDYHFEVDTSKLVFDEILSWINSNPLNMGPNYKCSQEMSLRILNWTFALYYYKNSQNLSETIFNKILNSIYHQLNHVYHNINFSRKTVRNNHAITETLALYLNGLLFPSFPNAKLWKAKGKKWFEEEIDFQIFDDGSYLQYSMNYHRVVVQLLTWAIILTKRNNERFTDIVYKKANLSLQFLLNFINQSDGYLPNYGTNDGALFFKLNNSRYRDYRPQLNAFSYALNDVNIFTGQDLNEDIDWYGGVDVKNSQFLKNNLMSFDVGGFYTINDQSSFTFIKCGKHNRRPFQADNLHLDIWENGQNIMRDAGSYLYNTDEELLNFFNGTKSHNTAFLGNHDQMLKGSRFIWYYWSHAISADLIENDDYYLFEGQINAFMQLDKNIYHTRVVKKFKDISKWEITDRVKQNLDQSLTQIWNPSEMFFEEFEISSIDENGNNLEKSFQGGWFSEYYGIKEETKQILFKTKSKKITTIIQKKAN